MTIGENKGDFLYRRLSVNPLTTIPIIKPSTRIMITVVVALTRILIIPVYMFSTRHAEVVCVLISSAEYSKTQCIFAFRASRSSMMLAAAVKGFIRGVCFVCVLLKGKA